MAVNLSPPKPEDLLPVKGVKLGVAEAGIRKAGRKDLLLMTLAEGTRVAGVFTQNRFCAAPVQVAKEHLASGRSLRAFIVNTGNANAGTGKEGLARAKASCGEAARLLGCDSRQVLPFSTGVIMEPLPLERIVAGLPACVADLREDNWARAAETIMTTDTVPKARILPVIEAYRGLLDFAEVVPLSARTGDNVERLTELLLAHLPEGERLYPEDFLTDQPERFFVAEMIRERILHHTREEIPYSTGVVLESFQEEEGLVRIQAEILVEREGQKGILIGCGGAMLKAVGTEARQQIEEFLGTKVFLGLFVKVREGWREDEGTLEAMGLLEKGGED